ncbi:2-oxoglutarate dehydrogenase E1 component [Acuticoccus sp. I52.16.1]|uniref:2-oxoglutarate dehydrogenase E1 component n=1 Tax=Acuticoccus sp. I52.16.1 TaxID=2928472 RepID=UPI001FD2D2E8|nr:2-oxoglutarate dehydrogenase E1 component [Acuticoccus sp. I52.16.1]UOM34785.1 2-oxoglutarate dehydrogenase E1 component [Acuticoccus sp. I52.16.1]
MSRDTSHLAAGDPGAIEALVRAQLPGPADLLVDRYRRTGWLAAHLDPLAPVPPLPAALDPAAWPSVEDLAEALGAVYCGTLGWEFGHVQDPVRFAWLAAEAERAEPPSDADRARAAYLTAAGEAFEAATLKRLPTVKTFGMSGAESFLAAIDGVIRHSDAREVVVGGMHRGRLTQLGLVFGKPLARLVAEAKGTPDIDPARGAASDVPYHLGHRGQREDGVAVWVAPHPSHLSIVAPVATGYARGRPGALALMLHTDAAFAGQGVNMELMQLGALAGYDVGGTVHLVLNNQVGFTTAAAEARTARTSADIAKLVEAPILHVNGDDPDALLVAARTAARYRAAFARDIVVEVVTYRRRGHNEMEESRFTQPLQQAAIDALPPVSERYVAAGAPEPDLAAFRRDLDAAFAATPAIPNDDRDAAGLAADIEARMAEPVATGVAELSLAEMLATLAAPPAGFDVHPRVTQFLDRRGEMARGERPIDWATAEALAFASLVADGHAVRLSGQDTARGAFAQRHLVIADQSDGRTEAILARFGPAETFNSPLIENAALGFEYGLSVARPDQLTVWEAQFGDFLNVCQPIFDQYVTGGEDRWLFRSSLVMMLPHGWDGGGPDHSTGHLERVLARCARGNITVAMPTTPANLFHILRRQVSWRWRKPLVLMTPKKMLRAAQCVSIPAEFAAGTHFRPVIAEDVSAPSRVIVCAGKVALTLAEARKDAGCEGDVAIVRVEQLYPFPEAELAAALARWPAAEIVWVQEEPENLGAFTWADRRLERAAGRRVRGICRPAAASPAVGWGAWHAKEEEALLRAAVDLARPGSLEAAQ